MTNAVYNYVILVGSLDAEREAEFNKRLPEGSKFNGVGFYAGGLKSMMGGVWLLGAYEYPTPEKMLSVFESFPWRDSRSVTLLFKGPEDRIWVRADI